MNENVLDNLVDKFKKKKIKIEISHRILLCSSPIKTKPKKEKRSTTLSEVGSTSNPKNWPVNTVPMLKKGSRHILIIPCTSTFLCSNFCNIYLIACVNSTLTLEGSTSMNGSYCFDDNNNKT